MADPISFCLISMAMQGVCALISAPSEAVKENKRRKEACEAHAHVLKQIEDTDDLIHSLVPGKGMNEETRRRVAHLAEYAQSLHKQAGTAAQDFVISTAIQVILCIAVTAGLIIYLVVRSGKRKAELGDIRESLSRFAASVDGHGGDGSSVLSPTSSL